MKRRSFLQALGLGVAATQVPGIAKADTSVQIYESDFPGISEAQYTSVAEAFVAPNYKASGIYYIYPVDSPLAQLCKRSDHVVHEWQDDVLMP